MLEHEQYGWIVRRATAGDFPVWARMLALLHDLPLTAELLDEVKQLAALDEPYVAFLAFDHERAVGMIDARVRNYAEGSPVLQGAYIEDVWVEPNERGKGVGRALLGKVEEWARAQGLQWLGSDTAPENSRSIAWHKAVGLKEVERLVVFGKPLT